MQKKFSKALGEKKLGLSVCFHSAFDGQPVKKGKDGLTPLSL